MITARFRILQWVLTGCWLFLFWPVLFDWLEVAFRKHQFFEIAFSVLLAWLSLSRIYMSTVISYPPLNPFLFLLLLSVLICWIWATVFVNPRLQYISIVCILPALLGTAYTKERWLHANVTAVLVLFGAFWLGQGIALFSHGRALPTFSALHELPHWVGPYNIVTASLQSDFKAPDVTLAGEYHNGDQKVFCQLFYYAPRTGTQFLRYAKNSVFAQNWSILEGQDKQVVFGNSDLPVKELLLEANGHKRLVWYSYFLYQHVTTDLAGFEIFDYLPWMARSLSAAGVVILSLPLDEAALIDKGRETLTGFLEEAFPVIFEQFK